MERNMPLGESQERVSGDRSIPEVRDLRPPAIPPSRYLDRVLLIGTALLVGMTGVGSFWLADHFQVNPVWVFAAWSSILIVPLFIKDFRAHLKKPSFVAYLVAWALIHGLLVATLMRWLSLPAMLPFLAIELIGGRFAADYLFGIRHARNGEK